MTVVIRTDPHRFGSGIPISFSSFATATLIPKIIMSNNTPSSLSFPPLECMQADDYEAADAARQRLTPKSRLRLFSSLNDLRKRKQSNKSASKKSAEADKDTPAILGPSTGTEDNVINLDGSAITDSDVSKDIYRWATLYENQRGCVHMSLFDSQLINVAQINNIFNTLLL